MWSSGKKEQRLTDSGQSVFWFTGVCRGKIDAGSTYAFVSQVLQCTYAFVTQELYQLTFVYMYANTGLHPGKQHLSLVLSDSLIWINLVLSDSRLEFQVILSQMLKTLLHKCSAPPSFLWNITPLSIQLLTQRLDTAAASRQDVCVLLSAVSCRSPGARWPCVGSVVVPARGVHSSWLRSVHFVPFKYETRGKSIWNICMRIKDVCGPGRSDRA